MKIKTPILLLLSFVLILLGALLPMLVGMQQDAANDGEVFLAAINDVQLEFSESDVTMKETISILCGGTDSVEIPPDLANLHSDRASDIALAMARQLQEAGIAFENRVELNELEDPEFSVQYFQTVLASSSTVDGQSNIFWTVVVCSKDGTQVLDVVIDDRTGTVCSLDYRDDYIAYNKTRMKSILYTFCKIYLDELGEEFYDYDRNSILSSAKSPTDNAYLASEINWWANDFEYRTTFFVNTHGFYTYLDVVSY